LLIALLWFARKNVTALHTNGGYALPLRVRLLCLRSRRHSVRRWCFRRFALISEQDQ